MNWTPRGRVTLAKLKLPIEVVSCQAGLTYWQADIIPRYDLPMALAGKIILHSPVADEALGAAEDMTSPASDNASAGGFY